MIQAAKRKPVSGGQSKPAGQIVPPSHIACDVESLCNPDLPFSTLLDRHMQLLAGKAPHSKRRWSNTESAQTLEVSLDTFISWRMGYLLPASIQLDRLIDHLLLSSHPRQGDARQHSGHPHATSTQIVAMQAALREAYSRDPLLSLVVQRIDPILVSGRAEFATWLRARGLTLREIGERLGVSRSAVAAVLAGHQSRRSKESIGLARCLEALRVWSLDSSAPPVSCWPFPISIPANPANPAAGRDANEAMHSPQLNRLTPL